MRCLKWILTSLALLPGSSLALPTFVPATSFFRSPQSEFKSGQTNRVNLEKNLLRTEAALSYYATWNRKGYLLPADDLLLDVHCASRLTLKENSLLLDADRTDGKSVAELSRGAEVELRATRNHWARVYSSSKKKEGWLPLMRLEARNEDTGVYVPLIDTFLRDQADSQGKLLTTIPRRARLEALEILANGWIRVRYEGQTGYVDLHHVAARADFAVWAWHPQKNWLLVSHREGANLKTPTGEVLPLKEIQAYATHAGRAIVIQTESDQQPPLRAHVDIHRVEATLWGVSQLEGHGEVWWKKEALLMEDRDSKSESILTTEELLSREVFSYALKGVQKPEGLVSAKGIWRTDDGLRWTKIDQFGDEDLPVSINNDGSWYVGSYRSKNQGKNFEAFIRWDDLARLIEADLHRPARYLKLQKVESLPNSRVEIQVDTGIRRLRLQGLIGTSAWKVLR